MWQLPAKTQDCHKLSAYQKVPFKMPYRQLKRYNNRQEQTEEREREPHIHPLSCHARRLYEWRVEKKLLKKRGDKRQRKSSAREDDDPAYPTPQPSPTPRRREKHQPHAGEGLLRGRNPEPAEALQKHPPASWVDPSPPEVTAGAPVVVQEEGDQQQLSRRWWWLAAAAGVS